MMQAARRWWVILAGAVVPALVAWRAWHHPVDTYGDSGAGYIEHLERIRVIHRLSTAGGSLLERLRSADGLYPPGLHLLSAPASFLGAHQPQSVTILGAGWLLLLAVATGQLARSIHPKASGPACLATLIIPSLHAVAPRYYYDLPMTALIWLAAARLAHSDQKPLRQGTLAAMFFAMACFVKWSALPLGLSVALSGGLIAARNNRRAAIKGICTFSVLLAILVIPVLLHSTSFGSMGGATFQPPPGMALPPWASSLDGVRPGLGHALGSMAIQAQLDGLQRVSFYVGRLSSTIFAPALVPSVLAILGVWLFQKAPGSGFLASACTPVVLFVWLAVPPLDERFLLTIVPCFAVVAGVVFATRWHGQSAFIIITWTIGLLVAVDFHTGRPTLEVESPATTGHQVPLRWGLSTSIDRRGWARLSDLPDHQRALRRDLLHLVDQCNATSITGDDLLISDKGDLNWWTFALERMRLVDGGPDRLFRPLGSQLGPAPTSPELAVVRPDGQPPDGFERVPSTLAVEVWAIPGTCPGLR